MAAVKENYQICIADRNTPIVVCFGGIACGKMMALKRLSLYLETLGYHIAPDFTLRPASDKCYERKCAGFMEFVYSDKISLGSAPRIILTRVVSHRGMPVCQILKLPGTSCFDIDFVNEEFPSYFNYIINAPNKKIWLFFLDEYTMMYRTLFTSRALQLMRMISRKDGIVLLRSKVDTRMEYYNHRGIPNMALIANEIHGNFPALVDFANHFLKAKTSGLLRFFPRKIDFVAFSAGRFNPTGDGRLVYTPDEDFYPEQLWSVITKNLKYN